MSEPDPLVEREDQRAELERRRAETEIQEENDDGALAALLERQDVRDYLWRIIARCNTLAEGFDPNFGKTGYNLGRQSVGRMIITDIAQVNPQAWLQMQLRAGERQAAEHAERRRKRLRGAR